MPVDKSYLAMQGPSWRVQVAVPKALQPSIGASVLFASTKTDSLALANIIRPLAPLSSCCAGSKCTAWPKPSAN
jgi:hypothetical protein